MMKISFSKLMPGEGKGSKRGRGSCISYSPRAQSMSNVHHLSDAHGRSLSGIMLGSSNFLGIERCRSTSSRSIANLCQTNMAEAVCNVSDGSRHALQAQRSFLHVMRCKISKKFRQSSNEKDQSIQGEHLGSSWAVTKSGVVEQDSDGSFRHGSSKKSATSSVYPTEHGAAGRNPHKCLRMTCPTNSNSSSLKGSQFFQAEAERHVEEGGSQPHGHQIEVDELSTHPKPFDWSLAQELQKLLNYGWYWGPISGIEAEKLLNGKPDGVFLVRDSSNDHYVLSLSFRSCGKTRHTRIRHCNNTFSFYECSASDLDSFHSIPDLIKDSMERSEADMLCYGKDSFDSTQAMPVRLTRPLSRLERVHSLQALCRFVIRQSVRLDRIQQLPLPPSMKTFIEEKLF